jgi:hypothetical protein
MVLLKRVALLLALAGCTFNPAIEVSKIVCVAGDDNTCPSGYTCTLTEASPEGLCCRGSKGACTEEPPALATRGAGTGGDQGEADGSAGGGGQASGPDARGDLGGTEASANPTGGTNGGGGTGGAGTGGAGTGGTSSDAAVPGDATSRDTAADLSPDLPTSPTCVPACTVGDKRCGPGGGVRPCVLVAGCPAWGVEMSCGSGGRRVCMGTEPGAHCECPAGPTSCNNQAGAYCGSASALETCVADADGCIYKGPTTTCSAGKPCTGNLPSASCSCGAPPPACMGTSGNLCTGSSTLITCGSNSEGCPAVTAMKTCGPSETCQGSPGSAACQCNAPPAACAGVGNATICSSNSVLMCGTTGNGCVTSSPVKSCTAGKPCTVAGGVADCRCGAAAPECTGVTGTVCQGTTTVLSCGTNADGCATSSVAKTCTGTRQCGGSPADCLCPNEPSLTDCPGPDGSRCVGNQVYTCSTGGDGCHTLTKATCPASGACVGTSPSAHCVSETNVGSYADLGGMAPHSEKYLTGIAINIGATVTLKRFGMVFKGSETDRRATFGLYASDGAGEPTTLVAAAVDRPLSTASSGRNEFAVTSPVTTVTLAPGKYWLMTTFNLAATYVGHDTNVTNVPLRYVMHTWGNPLDSPLAGVVTGSTTATNVYLVVLQ